MDVCVNRSLNDIDHNNSTTMSGYEESETIDFTPLLEDIEKIDNLEGLEDIEQMLLAENQKMTNLINICSHQNSELKDELNTAKCFIKKLDQLYNDELQLKIENLRENIQLKQQEVLQEQNQQVDDLDQFELDVTEISTKFFTAPKEYEKKHLKMKIDNLMSDLEEKKVMLDEGLEKFTSVKFQKEPIQSMDVPLTVFNNVVSEITSSNSNFTKTIDEMSKEIDKLRFEIKTNNITKFNLGKY